MKPNKLFPLLIAAALFHGLVSCSDRPDRMFKDFFVYVQDENGMESSRVSSTSNNLLVTYYFQLVSEAITEPLTVDFDLVVGDGLVQDRDFKLQSESRSVTFEPGVYKKPFRIVYLNHEVDPSKDNTLRIVIRNTSNPGIIIGYPGPNARFSSHTITKYNQ